MRFGGPLKLRPEDQGLYAWGSTLRAKKRPAILAALAVPSSLILKRDQTPRSRNARPSRASRASIEGAKSTLAHLQTARSSSRNVCFTSTACRSRTATRRLPDQARAGNQHYPQKRKDEVVIRREPRGPEVIRTLKTPTLNSDRRADAALQRRLWTLQALDDAEGSSRDGQSASRKGRVSSLVQAKTSHTEVWRINAGG